MEVLGLAASVALLAGIAGFFKSDKSRSSASSDDAASRPGHATGKGSQDAGTASHFDPKVSRASDGFKRYNRRMFVFDTNSLIDNPYCIFAFKGGDVLIPFLVHRELESIKHDPSKSGFTRWRARTALDMLHQLTHLSVQRATDEDAFLLPFNGGGGEHARPRLYLPAGVKVDVPKELDHEATADDQVIAFALEQKQLRETVFIVTSDRGVNIKARSLKFDLHFTAVEFTPPQPPKPKPPTPPVDAQMDVTLRAMHDAISDRPELADMAFSLFKNAAEAGSIYAARVLGGMYYTGLGVAKSRQEAVRWIAKAALGSDTQAFDILKLMALAGDTEI